MGAVAISCHPHQNWSHLPQPQLLLLLLFRLPQQFRQLLDFYGACEPNLHLQLLLMLPLPLVRSHRPKLLPAIGESLLLLLLLLMLPLPAASDHHRRRHFAANCWQKRNRRRPSAGATVAAGDCAAVDWRQPIGIAAVAECDCWGCWGWHSAWARCLKLGSADCCWCC